MRPIACWLALVTAVGVVAAADADRVGRLVAALSSPDFHEREAATHDLDQLGPAALDALRQAARCGDAETRRRAADLVDRIGRRVALARILNPTLVDLNYENAQLADAVADLARRTGLPITLHGDTAKHDGRTVTLAADKVTVWQALRLFCDRAGLHEWDGASQLPSTAGEKDGPTSRNDAVLIVGQTLARRGLQGPLALSARQTHLALIDGAGPSLPAHHAGSIRVRAVRAGLPVPVEVGKDSTVTLSVTAEQRLHIDGASDVRIERAIDDRGRDRVCRPVWIEPSEDREEMRRGRVPSQILNHKRGPVAVRIEPGDGPPKRLRELRGVVTVNVFTAEPVVDVPRPAEAIGRTVRAGAVGLTPVTVERASPTEWRVVAELRLPYGVRLEQPITWPILVPGRGGFGRPFGGIQFDEPEPVPITGNECQGLTLCDGTGRRFAAVTGCTEIVGLYADSFTVHVTATYRVPAGVEPARLGFSVHRPKLVDVPFCLRDITFP
jgi:hypothetical protein